MLNAAFALARKAYRIVFRSGGQQPPDDSPIYHGAPLRVDPDAVSNEPGVAPFIARPPGSPVYYGFPVLDDVEVDGFKFGMITDFEAQADEVGDAFVVAPDNSRCGLNWYVQSGERFEEVLPIDADRWGVWDVSFPYPMTSRENVRRNLAFILPRLRPKWEEWRKRFGTSGEPGATS